MLYPRKDERGRLIFEDQNVGVREHLSVNYRLLFLTGTITSETESHNLLIALDSLNHKPIKLVMTSPGGDLDSAFLLYDTIKLIRSPIWTLGRYAASAAVLLLAAGEKRYLSPHAKVMLHLPSAQAYGDAHDWAIQHKEMQKYESKMVDILIECGARRSHEQIVADIDRDLWLEPQEAIEYGLADEVMTPKVLEEWVNGKD